MMVNNYFFLFNNNKKIYFFNKFNNNSLLGIPHIKIKIQRVSKVKGTNNNIQIPNIISVFAYLLDSFYFVILIKIISKSNLIK